MFVFYHTVEFVCCSEFSVTFHFLAHQTRLHRARWNWSSSSRQFLNTQSPRAQAQAMLSTARARCAYQLFISFQCGGAACTVWERASLRKLSAPSNCDNNATVNICSNGNVYNVACLVLQEHNKCLQLPFFFFSPSRVIFNKSLFLRANIHFPKSACLSYYSHLVSLWGNFPSWSCIDQCWPSYLSWCCQFVSCQCLRPAKGRGACRIHGNNGKFQQGIIRSGGLLLSLKHADVYA